MHKFGFPTIYHGLRYRSQLEVRWRVYLDVVGVPCQYEPEQFWWDREQVGYVPDFYLPTLHAWAEVKPRLPDLTERRKAQLLADETGEVVYFLLDTPRPGVRAYVVEPGGYAAWQPLPGSPARQPQALQTAHDFSLALPHALQPRPARWRLAVLLLLAVVLAHYLTGRAWLDVLVLTGSLVVLAWLFTLARRH